LLFLLLSWVQISSSVPCFETPSAYAVSHLFAVRIEEQSYQLVKNVLLLFIILC
jgi:hypothetical protein